jgi:PKD repeat protein
MENFSLSLRFTEKNKGTGFLLAIRLISLFLILSASLFNALYGQCPATLSVFPSNVVCQGNNVILTAAANSGSTYLWYKNGISMDSTRSQLVVNASGNYYASTMPCGMNSDTVTITVNPLPPANFTFSPNNTPCASTPITFDGPAGVGISYSWNFGDPASGALNTSTDENPDHIFEAYGNGIQNFTVQFTTTYLSGCSSSSSQTVAVTQKPDATLTDPNDFPPFTHCSLASDTLELTVQYTPLILTTNIQYQIHWGDGSPNWVSNTFPAAGILHIYAVVGNFNLIFTVTSANGCQNSKVYQVFNGSNPSLTVGSPGSTTGCIPATFIFPLGGWQSNAPSTTYSFSFGDGSPVVYLNAPLPATISHTYTSSSCSQPPPMYTYIVTAVASNPCGSTPLTIGGVQVSERPSAYFTTVDSVFCITDNIHFTNLTNAGCFIVGNSTNNSTNFTWNFGDGTTQTFTNITPANITSGASANHTYLLPGLYTVSLKAWNFGVGGCGDSTYYKQICITAQPNSSFTLSTVSGCKPLTVTATNTSTTSDFCHDRLYTWSVVFNGSLCDPPTGNWSFAPGSDLHCTNSTFIFNDPGNYIITLTVQNHCPAATSSHAVFVMTIPTVIITPLLPICEQGAVSPTAIFRNCFGTISGYSWTFPGGSPATSNQQTPGSITYGTAGTYTITASATNECGTGSGNTILNVKQLPVITATPSSQTICTGTQTQAVSFSSSLPGTTYSWWAMNPGAVGGVVPNGTVNTIPVMTLTNPTSSPQIVTYTIIPTASGCQGPAITHGITVNPSPGVTNNPMTQTVCSGQTTTNVVLTSNVAGTTFSWTATATAGISGFVAGGNAVIPPQTLVTTQFVAGTVTYIITPTANGCCGVPVNYVITVNPVPQITNNPLFKTICSGSSTNIILTSTVVGTTYTWTASCIAGTVTGFSASGSNNINETLINNGTIIGTVRYIIIPTRNGCPGIPTNFDVYVQPVSDAIAVPPTQTVCSGSQNAAIILTSNVPGTSFLWSAVANPPAGITGFVVSGSGNTIPPATISSILTVQGTVTYTIIPSIGGCDGTPTTCIITVDPSPMVTNNPMSQTVCSGNPSTPVTLTSNVGGTSFVWTATATPGISGFIPAGTNSIPSQILLNSNTTPGSVTFHITPSSNLGMSCPGSPADYTIFVDPVPSAFANPSNQDFCSGGQTGISLTSDVPVTTFNWTVSLLSGSVAGQSNGSGNSIVQTLTNPGIVDGTVRYTILPVAAGCSGNGITVDITVHPSPVVTTIPVISQSICSGDQTSIAISSTIAGSVFSWTAALTSGNVTGFSNGSGALIAQTITNLGTIPGVITYTIHAISNGCIGPDKVFQVTVNPIPVLFTNPANNLSICSKQTTNIVLTSTITGTTYTWSGSLTSGTVTGFSSGTCSPIAETLINNGAAAGVVTYDITPSFAGCYGSTVHFPVTVNSLPAVNAGPDQIIPFGTSTTLSGSASGGIGVLLYNWTPPGMIASGGTTLTAVTTNLNSSTLFTLIVTDGLGCQNTDDAMVNITGAGLSVNPQATPNPVCAGQQTHLTSNACGGSLTYTYSWTSVPAGLFSNAAALDVAPVVTTTYTVLVNDGFNTVSGSVTVTVNPLPSLFNVTGGGEYCNSGTGMPVGLSGSQPGINYQLFKDGSPFGSPVCGTGVSLSFGNLTPAGTYTVTATNTATTCTQIMSGNAIISINPLPLVNAGSDITIPYGTSTLLSGTANGGTGALAYSWTPAIDIASGGNTLTPLTTNLFTSTSFILLVTDSKGCSSSDQVIVFLSGSPLNVNVTALPQVICNNGTSVQLNASGSGGSGMYTYSWSSNPAGLITSLQNPIVTPSVTTIYTVTLNDGFNNASNSVTVTVNPLPALFSMTGGGEYCSGGTGVPVGLSGSETGILYQLLKNLSPVGGPLAGTGSALSFGNQPMAGNYTVSASNITTTCINNMAGSVTVTINPLPLVDAGLNKIIPNGTSTTLSGTANGGTGVLSYSWVPAINIASGITTLTPVTTNLYSNTTFTLTVTDSKTCNASDQMMVILTGNPLDVVAQVNPDTICLGNPVQLASSGSGGSGTYTYFWVSNPPGSPAWSSNLQNPIVTPTQTTVFKVTISDGFNSASDSGTAVVLPLPTDYAVIGDGSYCAGGSGIPVGLPGSDIGVSYRLYRNGFATGFPIPGTGAPISFGNQSISGDYTIKGTRLASGCQNWMSDTATVIILPLPPQYLVTGGGSYPAGGSGVPVGLASSDIGVNYRLVHETDTITPLPGIAGTGGTLTFGNQTLAGNYFVIAQNAITGCMNEMFGSVLIIINPYPSLHTVFGGGDICQGAPGKIVGLDGSDIGVQYILRRNGDSISSLYGTGDTLNYGNFNIAGNYTVKGINLLNGLQKIMNGNAVINVFPLPIAYLIVPAGDTCPGAEVLLNGSQSGVNYSLLRGTDTIRMIAGTGLFGFLNFGMQFTPGIYRIVGINATTGCKTDMAGTLTIHPAPAVFTINPPGIICPGTHITLSGSEIGINYQLRRDSLTNVGAPLAGTGSVLDFGAQTLPGVYRIIGTNPLTVCYSWMNDNSTIQQQPILYNIMPSGDTCAGALVRLNGSQAGILYRLVLNNTIYLDSLMGTGFPLVFGTYFTAGTYTIVAVSPISRCETVMTGSLHISNAPIAYNVLPNGMACSGDAISLDNSEIGVSYTLIRDGSVIAAGPIPGTGTLLYFGVQYYTGIYTVLAVNNLNGCSRTMNGSSTLSPVPTSYILQPQGNQCSGSDLFLNGSEIGIIYELLRDGIVVQTMAGTGLFIHFGPQFLTGTYVARAINSLTTCDTVMNGTTIITPLPLMFNATPPGANCSPTTIGLDGSQAGVTYQLYKNGAPVGLPLTGTGNSLSFGSQTAGNYLIIGIIVATSCADTMTGTVIITPGPTVEAGNDTTVCYMNSVQLQGHSTSTSTILWTSSGDGVFTNPLSLNTVYTTGNNDKLNGTVKLFLRGFGKPECSQMQVLDSLTVTISRIPLVNAGPDDTICASQTAQLNGSAQLYSTFNWKTSGDGTFNNPTILTPVYTPGLQDKTNGSVQLRLTVHGLLNCTTDTAFDDLTLIIEKLPLANAGPDATICENFPYTLAGSAQNASTYLWTTSGDGAFSNPGILNAVYTAGVIDKSAGSVRLVLTVSGSQHCINEISRDTMKLMFNPFPIVNAGNDTTICSNLAVNVNGTSQHSSATEWTTNGDGTFTNPFALNTIYHAGPADILTGVVILKLTAHGSLACSTEFAVDSMVLTLHHNAWASAGNDTLVCPNVFVQLNGSATNYTGIQWSSIGGDGTFDNPSILHPHYTPGTNDVAAGFVFIKLTANGTQECSMQTYTDTVKVTFRILPTASLFGTATVCAGTLTNLTVNLTGTAPWSVTYTDGSANFTLNNIVTTPYTIAVGPVVTTTYTLLGVSDLFCNGTITGGSVTITVKPLPLSFQMTTTGDGSYCEGGTGVVLGLDGSQNGISYQLLLGGMPDGIPLPGNGGPISFGNRTTPGIYKVRATNPLTTCLVVFNDSINLVEHPKPDVNFTADSTCDGQLTVFHLQGLDIGKVAQWHWNFGDGVTANYNSPVEPTHLYPTYGLYHVVLSVIDTNGCSRIVEHDISVYDLPVAFFSVSAPICAGVAVTFDDHSYTTGTNYIARWFWQFGDGNDTTVIWPGNPNITHIYNGSGTYSVTLTVTSNEGCNATRVRTITIDPHPVANFDYTAVCQNALTYFTDLSQTGGGGTVVEWHWNFGDPLSGTNNVSIVKNPVHMFSSTGDYTVRLYIITSNGCQDSIFKTLHVNLAPTANFSADTACFGTPTHFTDLSIANASSIVSWDWDFGDGSVHSFGQNPVHLYTSAGLFNAILTVTNSNGCSQTVTHAVMVLSKPVAAFIAGTANCSGTPVVFTDQSYASQGYITTWIWTFGDGSTQTILAPPPQYVYHTYTNGGTYNVMLTVQTSANCQTSITNVVTVFFTPVANFNTSGANCEGSAVHFTDSSQPNGGGPLMAWDWNFGDPGSGTNNTSNQQNPLHIYNNGGSFTATLIITNIHGCKDTITKPVMIGSAPTVLFTTDTVCKGNVTHFTDHTIANFGTLSTWLWNFGDGTPNSNIQNPTHTYTATGIFNVTLTVTNSGGCQSDTTEQVLVNEVPDALFSYDGSCLGAVTEFHDQSVSTGGTIAKWHWVFGDGDTSNLQNPSHIYTAPGTYTVLLTVTNSIGCTDPYSAPVIIFNRPTAAFSYFSTFCPAGRVTFTDHSVSNGAAITDWLWTFEPGFYSTSANPTYTYSTTNMTYPVTLVVTDENGCKDTIVDSIFVKPGFQFTFLADTVCLGTSTNFHPVNLAEGDSLHDLHWVFGDPASGTYNTSTLYNPTHEFSVPGIYTVKLSAWDLNNCNDSVYKEVVVYPAPAANFTFDSLPHCDGVAIFYNISNGNGAVIDTLVWDFGDGTTLTQLFTVSSAVTHTYAQYGKYRVALKAINARGCQDTISKLVMINCITAGFIISDTLHCSMQRVTFMDYSTPVAFIDRWTWEFGDGTDTSYTTKANSVRHRYAQPGNYTVKLYVRSVRDGFTITDTLNHQIKVQPTTMAEFTLSNVCHKDTARFVNLSDSNTYRILSTNWTFGEPGCGNEDTCSMFNAGHRYLYPGKYNVSLVVKNQVGCMDTLMQRVTIYKHPKAAFTVPDVCSRQSVAFINLSTPGDTVITRYSWHFGDTSNPVDTSNRKSPDYSYPHEGTYKVFLLVKDAYGCKDTLTKDETVLMSPVSAFTIEEDVNGIPGKIKMDNESINASLYEWNFGNGLLSNEEEPIVTYTNDGSYMIRLITWAANNCSDTTYLNYEFMFHNLFVPNALSPSNVIPEVRVFKPIGFNLSEYHVEVFDAWGHTIWGSRLLDDDGRPVESWDGTLNGELLPQDTYIWKISATFKDGTVWEGSDNGKGKGKTMGTVTIIR